MILYPAMDFLEGECVRLFKGERSQVETFDFSPVKWALDCEARGAKALHLVDLDGAFSGKGQNAKALLAIREAVKIPIEVGGGIRDFEKAKFWINEGFQIILGSLLTKDLELSKKILEAFPNQVIAGIDCKDFHIQTEGWVKSSGLDALSFTKELLGLGFKRFVFTDISKDGTLLGPNLEALSLLNALDGIELIASGGVANTNHLKKLKDLGLYGTIVGKALLNKTLNLDEALEVCHAD